MADTDILFLLENRKSNFWGVGNLNFFCMIDINEMIAIFQLFHNGQHWYSISVDTWKTGDPIFWEVGNLKFFCTINIYEMAAIFQFFHNGQHWYSIPVDTWKAEDPIFLGGVSNLKIFQIAAIIKFLS